MHTHTIYSKIETKYKFNCVPEGDISVSAADAKNPPTMTDVGKYRKLSYNIHLYLPKQQQIKSKSKINAVTNEQQVYFWIARVNQHRRSVSRSAGGGARLLRSSFRENLVLGRKAS